MPNNPYPQRSTAAKCVLRPVTTFLRRARKRKLVAVFEDIYRDVKWKRGYPETRSGYGSTVEYTQSTSDFIERIIATHNIFSIVDIGCGEMNWQMKLDLKEVKNYHGVDIVRTVIQDNIRRFGGDDRFSFACEDATKYQPKKFDLVICRDVLFHLSYKHIRSVIRNMGYCKYLIATSYRHTVNTDIRDGKFFRINLLKPPFDFPEPIVSQMEDHKEDRFVGLWSIKDLTA